MRKTIAALFAALVAFTGSHALAQIQAQNPKADEKAEAREKKAKRDAELKKQKAQRDERRAKRKAKKEEAMQAK